MLAVLLSADAERLSVEDENPAWHVWILKDSISENTVQVLQNRHMTLRTRGADPAIRTAIENVAVMKCLSLFSSSFLYPKRVSTGLTLTAPSTPTNRFPGTAKCALFFIGELREG